jgi:hypothetical protein
LPGTLSGPGRQNFDIAAQAASIQLEPWTKMDKRKKHALKDIKTA